MKFQMPETLDGLSIAELEDLHKAAFEEFAGLTMKDDVDISDADLADIEALGQHLETIETTKVGLEVVAQERADKLAAARGKVTEATAEVEDLDAEGDEDEEDDDEGDEPGEDAAESEDAEAEQEQELVTASAARRTVRKAASKSPPPQEVIPPAPGGSVLIAAANLPSIETATPFSDLSQASQIWGERAKNGPGGSQRPMLNYRDIKRIDPLKLSNTHVRQGFAKIRKPAGEFAITEGMTTQEQLDLIEKAANERIRFGAGGLAGHKALTAAGGWCAPSETVYDFCSFETVSGLLDIPSLTMPRGGLNYSKGPDYATLAADWGFLQTEAEAEAGEEKECYPVECPPFDEVRLDAIGFCVTAGVLTNAAYPELIRRVLEIGTVAHAHKVNAYVINRISTLIGTAVNYVEVGSNVSDILDAAVIQALRIRYQLAMAPGSTIEAVFPVWAIELIRSDVSRRLGIDNPLGVTDQMISSWFAVRGIAIQWVYDYQPWAAANTGTWTAFPATLQFMMYPAGAFIRGDLNVIDLDTIYDSVGLSTNTYTAAFFEEGIAVFNRCGFGVKVEVAGLDREGATGFPAVGAGAGVTFAEPETP